MLNVTCTVLQIYPQREQVYIQYLVIVLWVSIVTFCKMKALSASMKLPTLGRCLETRLHLR